MKVRTSHVITALIVGAGIVVALAVLRSPRPNPSKVKLDSTDKFLSQVQDIRERGGGSSIKEGQVLSIDKKVSDKPALEFEQLDVDMGVVPNDKPTVKRVSVKNVSGNPVDIMEVRTSCHCTEGKFDYVAVLADGREVATIPPGGDMGLVITVYPDRIHGFYAKKQLTIATNDPVMQQYLIDVTTRVDPELKVEPDIFDFGTVQRGTPAEIRGFVRQLTDTPVTISKVQVPNIAEGDPKKGKSITPPVTIEVVRRPESEWASPGKTEWDIIAKLEPDAPLGEYAPVYWLVTDLKRVAEIEGKIYVKVVSFFDVSPASLGARNVVTPGQAKVATATVSSAEPIAVSDITVSGNDLGVEVVPGASPNAAEIVLSVKPDATAGLKNETVEFTVKSGDKTSKHSMRAFVSVQASAPAA